MTSSMLALAAGCVAFSCAAVAQAQVTEAPPAPAPAPAPAASAELASFVAFVEAADTPARTYRWVGGLAALGVGGLVTPVAATMVSRDADVPSGLALGLGIGSAVSGAFVLLGSTPRPYRDAAEAVAREQALGHGDRAALAAGEAELRGAAADERFTRQVGGGIMLGLGTIALGLGTTFAAADFTDASFDRGEQDGVAAALLIGGAMSTAGAIEFLIFPSPEETAWETYAATRTHASSRPGLQRFAVTPLPRGGAAVGLGGSF